MNIIMHQQYSGWERICKIIHIKMFTTWLKYLGMNLINNVEISPLWKLQTISGGTRKYTKTGKIFHICGLEDSIPSKSVY